MLADDMDTLRGESYLLVHVKLPEDLCRIQKVLIFKNPIKVSILPSLKLRLASATYFLPFQANRGRFKMSAIQYPLIRKRNVRKAWTAASGMM